MNTFIRKEQAGVPRGGVDEHIIRRDGTDTLQDSPFIISDAGIVTSSIAGGAMSFQAGTNVIYFDDANVSISIDTVASPTGYVDIYTGDSEIYFDDSVMLFSTQGGNKFEFKANGGFSGILDFSSIAASAKTFTFPNTTGTVALETAASGTFISADAKTITVVNGIITSIV